MSSGTASIPVFEQQLLQAQKRLKIAGVADPFEDIKKITEYVTKAQLTIGEHNQAVLALIERRINREPLERIFGASEFFGYEFELSEAVYRPCQETETTVEHALLIAEKFDKPLNILDLGTGSGCMLISLLKKLPNAKGTGVDISLEALDLAKRNAERNGVSNRVSFIQTDWTSNLNETFDIIISNPPRIPRNLVPKLVREVSEYDPSEALNGGDDGLLFYRRLAEDFRKIAKNDTVCIVQVGQMLLDQICYIFKDESFSGMRIGRDYKYSPNCVIFMNSKEKESVFNKFKIHLIKFFGKK
ncbi:MAG: peptide chain release factor N(5)-glutamine methyltransferase [Pseudobdellovibrionaceae bacterium]|nr:peptide chain release factor N(5)-glutamine methyltransferase [Pseudobdellovibrionaceae bacterium]